MVPDLVRAITALRYPGDRSEVIVLLEEDDPGTLHAMRKHAPKTWRIVVAPPGQPRTKPRACNIGLALARGEIVVVFDGEDRPEPEQARRAVAGLLARPGVAVAQARLACDHAGPRHPLLARLWGLEYATLFGLIQPALAGAGLPFLLGGTSNWFRAEALRAAGGWDAHNVTEDADLGVRLARLGWRSTVVSSTTWEEAPVKPRAWLHQRSRWLKGFAVTTMVHARQPVRTLAELGPLGAFTILAQLPATLACVAAHPVGIALLVSGALSGKLAFLMLSGYAITIGAHAFAAQRAGLQPWLALLLPFYWFLHAAAFALAIHDLLRNPAHWRKTAHGLAPDRSAAGRTGRPATTTRRFRRAPAAANSAEPPPEAGVVHGR